MDSEMPPSRRSTNTGNDDSLHVPGTSIRRTTAIVLGIAVLITLGFVSKAAFSKSVATTTSVSTTSIAGATGAALPVLPTTALQGASRNDVVLVPIHSGFGSSKLHQYTPHGSTLYIQYACEGNGSFAITGYFKISSCPQVGVALLDTYPGQAGKSAVPRVVAPRTIHWTLFISSGP